MEIQISQQLALFGQSVLLGLGAAVLYDLIRAVRLRLPRATALLDMVYTLCVGTALFLFTLRRAAGLLRGYVLLGALGGAVLFFACFRRRCAPCGPFGWIPWLFGALAGFSPGLDEKFFKKNCDFRKKCLLFCVEMLYNKKNWTQIVQRGERGAAWQDKSAAGCGQVS